jgi:putative transposase
VVKAVQGWIAAVGARTAYIERGSPWENGYIESFNGKLKDELLRGEIFCSLREAEVLIEAWRRHYNTRRPHSALGYRSPAPEVASYGLPLQPCGALSRPAPASVWHLPLTLNPDHGGLVTAPDAICSACLVRGMPKEWHG